MIILKVTWQLEHYFALSDYITFINDAEFSQVSALKKVGQGIYLGQCRSSCCDTRFPLGEPMRFAPLLTVVCIAIIGHDWSQSEKPVKLSPFIRRRMIP